MERMKLKEVGEVSHYYSKIGVAVVELKAPVSVGDRILISGATTYFEQKIASMQIEHKSVSKAKARQSIGLKVSKRVRERDIVYKVM